ncbi:hypothetical protein BD324DRAFT_619113 [Kockovaella imperatae]|uniref:Uncharacterized protein n=1 Tax=Kockovaella imperatae TaxID=4999 RepID=A0A1Y1UP08_9TREE|nr:hypothetical protein BD324DRAFT_619113 [Kockovaella imperatae]ORX39277.1 hypothetical protein BD324DRAFT_619113 [Kockovaella imperatae]
MLIAGSGTLSVVGNSKSHTESRDSLHDLRKREVSPKTSGEDSTRPKVLDRRARQSSWKSSAGAVCQGETRSRREQGWRYCHTNARDNLHHLGHANDKLGKRGKR